MHTNEKENKNTFCDKLNMVCGHEFGNIRIKNVSLNINMWGMVDATLTFFKSHQSPQKEENYKFGLKHVFF